MLRDLLNTAAKASAAGDHASAVRAMKQVFDASPEFLATEAAAYIASFRASERRQFWTAPAGQFRNPADLKATFSTIYAQGVWGGGSGEGSDLRHTVNYTAYVQHLMERSGARRIVDLGCGDWRFSRHLEFQGRSYLGVDIVPSVIADNRAAHGSETVRFEAADVTAFEVPECDLLLCKDVLQHLSNANAQKILARSRAARIALFTNDYHPANEDQLDGNTRPLDITRPPFSVPAQPRLAFVGKISFLVTRQA